MKGVKRILLVLLILVVLFAGAVWVFAGQLTKTLMEEVQIGQVDLSHVDDGAYKETYSYNEGMGATVVVTVMDHQIETIFIQEHKTGLGKKAEKIVDRVIEEQSLHVDAVSGATGSSLIILKAIENALK
jgi:uncharacterized protein with FMN-binding domain